MILDPGTLFDLLPDRRWFGGKGRSIRKIDIYDSAVLDDGPPALVVALAIVELDDETRHRYHLPLIVEPDGRCRDALEDIERLRLFGDLMAHGHTVKGERGAFHFGGPGLNPLAPPGAKSIGKIPAEQSNSSLVLDDDIILKLFRRVEIGPNPDLEIGRLLTNEGFENIPSQVGEIIYEIEDDEASMDLGIAQKYITGGVDGWEHTLEHIGRLYDEVKVFEDALDDRSAAQIVEQQAAEILGEIDELGDVTASLHVQLSREELEADFAPEPVGSYELKRWADAISHAFDVAQETLPSLAGQRDALNERLDQLCNLPDAGWKARVHGDYHLGQVMLAQRGWLILDFEGEPARPLEERRAKQSPLRDVAGMLRSFNYAALATLFYRSEPGAPEWERLEPWALTWETVARDRFLSGYLSKAHEGRFLPPDRDAYQVLIDAFEIDKALYEVRYEHAHRPAWVRIPELGLQRLLGEVPE